MKEVELQSIKFNISADTESAVNGVEALKNSLSAFSRIRTEAMDNATDSLERLAECVRAISDAASGAEGIARLAASLSALGSVNLPDMGFADQIREISDAVRDFETGNVYEIHDVVLTLQTLGQINLPSPELAIRIREISDAALSWDIETSGAMRDLVDVLRGFDGISQIPSGISDGIREILEAAGDVQDDSLRRLGELADILQRLGSVRTGDYRINLEARTNLREVNATARETSGLFGRIQSGLRNIGRSLLALPLSPLRSMASSIRGIGNAVSSLFERVQRIVLYRIIRQALRAITQGFKEGLENLYKYSQAVGTTLAGSMDRLATSALYMKNSLAAMAAPIIEAIAPAIDFVIDKVVEAMNWINQFIAKLTGKDTWTRAVRQATTWGDTTNEAGKNAASGIKAANDELKRSILAFDELNVLSKPNKNVGSTGSGSSSSGTGNGANYATMFEEVPIDSKIGDFAESIKEAFQNGDWYGIGQILGDKLNEIVESLPTYEWGQRIGEKINMAIGIAHGFLETADFSMIGAKIADGINGVLKTVNFKEGGEVLALSLTSVLDLVGGFLGKLDFGAAATAVSDGITGFFGKLTEWVRSKEWETIGKEAYNKVKDFISNLKLDEMVSSISAFLGSATRAIGDSVKGFFSGLGSDLDNWWTTEVQADTWEETAKNFLGKSIGGFLTGLRQNVINPFMEELARDDLWELGVTKVVQNIWNALDNNEFGSFLLRMFIAPNEYENLHAAFSNMDINPDTNIVTENGERYKGYRDENGGIRWEKITEPLTNIPVSFELQEENAQFWKDLIEKGQAKGIVSSMLNADTPFDTIKKIAEDKEAFGKLSIMIGLNPDTAEPLRQSILTSKLERKLELTPGLATDVQNDRIKKILSGEIITADAVYNVKQQVDKENTTTTGKLFWKGEARKANYILKWNLDDTTTTGKNFWNGKGRNALFLPLWNLDNTTTTGKNFWNGQERNAGFVLKWNLDDTTTTGKNFWNGKERNAGFLPVWNLEKTSETGKKFWNGTGIEKTISLAVSLAKSQSLLVNNIWNSTSLNRSLTLAASYGGNASVFAKQIAENNVLNRNVKLNILQGTNNTGLNIALWTAASGGVFQNGRWGAIPQFAGGGSPHGSLFVAGEAGPEVVGHIGGRTEVLNASQLAAVMYSSIVAGMSRTSGFEAAVGDALAGRMDDQNRLLEEQNRLLEQMLAGGLVAEISSSSISRAETWRNRRAGVFAAYG